MTPSILEFAGKAFAKHPFTVGRCLELGAFNVNGSIREVFQKSSTEYIGVDQNAGPDVDVVLRSQEIESKFKPQSFDTILCCEMLEHDPAPFETIRIINSLIKPHGWLFISTPTFGFPLHRWPKDYFRYGEDCYHEIFFKGYDIKELTEVKDFYGSPIIACLGCKLS